MTTSPTRAVVLVADDEPSMLSLIAQHVRTLGHTVHLAHDGEEAWSQVETQRPDLVLLDVMMPAMSGWEVCRKIREDRSLSKTAVIMITGIGERLNEMTSPLFGADHYLDKPFELGDLDRAIREVLAKRGGGTTTAPAKPAPAAPRAAAKATPAKKAATPAKKAATPAKKAATPAKKAATSAIPTKKAAKKAAKPAKKAAKPLKKAAKPLKKAAKPLKKAAKPMKKAAKPLKRAAKSLKKGAKAAKKKR